MKKDKKVSLLENFCLKNDLISYGVDIPFSIEGISYAHFVKSLYDYDQLSPKKVVKYPQEIVLDNKDYLQFPFYVRVRRNHHSVWKLISNDGTVCLLNKNNDLCIPVRLSEYPKFYDASLKTHDKEEPVTNYVHKLGSDVLSVVVNNYCSFYQEGMECHFCELKKTYESTKLCNTPVKNLDILAQAISIALQMDPTIKRIAINGGNFENCNNKTIEMYIKLLEKIKKLVPEKRWEEVERWMVIMPPKNLKLLEKLKEAGATLVLINLEIWPEDNFNYFCPGKAQYGQKEMLLALKEAVKIFGIGNVLSCMIYGVQSISKDRPYIFDGNLENKILLECLAALAECNVIQLINIYHETGRNKLGRIPFNAEDLLKYHIEYGKYIIKTNLIRECKRKENIIWGSLGSIPNSMNNEAAFLAFNGAI